MHKYLVLSSFAFVLGCSGPQTSADSSATDSQPTLDESPGIEIKPVDLTPEQQALADDINEQLTYYTETLRANCGMELVIDWATFVEDGKMDGLASTIASACQGPAMAAGEICADEGQKAALQTKADRIICTHVVDRGASGLTLAGGALVSRVVVENTGSGGDPSAYFAPDRLQAMKFFNGNL